MICTALSHIFIVIRYALTSYKLKKKVQNWQINIGKLIFRKKTETVTGNSATGRHHVQPSAIYFSLLGALLDLLRIFMRFLDIKYGFWRDPSCLSRSSTVRRRRRRRCQDHYTLYKRSFCNKRYYWDIKIDWQDRTVSLCTHRSRGRECPHTCCTRWRIRELWGNCQTQPSTERTVTQLLHVS